MTSLFLIVLWPLISSYSIVLQNRFQDASFEGANGRMDAWAFYITNWKDSMDSFFFGDSSNLEQYRIKLYGISLPVVQHNLYVESLSQIGLIGTLLMFEVYSNIFLRRFDTKGKMVFVGFIPLIVLLTCYFSLNGLFSDLLSLSLLVCFSVYSSFLDRVQQEP